MRSLVLFLTAAALWPSFAHPRVCPPTAPTPGAPVWFDFQVASPAQFVSADGILPFPDATLNQRRPFTSDFALVQFFVDSSGVPVATSLKILVQPAGLVAESVASAVQRWRYKPAVAKGCHVPQLVQSALRWK